MVHQLTVVDAFVDGPFSGNPAGVVMERDGDAADPSWMQAVASELALSETAFMGPCSGDDVHWLRWFTPTVEVDVCGHATLAAARVLFDLGNQRVAFDTRSGRLTCLRDGEVITIDLPADPSLTPYDRDSVSEAARCEVIRVGSGQEYVVAELASEAAVASLQPDLVRVARLQRTGLVVTAAGGGDADVVCRMFAPQCGIDEDPVTGSTWCALAGWWAGRVGTTFRGRQLSRRGGVLEVAATGDRVLLTGRTRLFSTGRILV